MKKYLAILSIITLCICLIGCGDKKDDGKITITYAAWNLGSADSDTPNMERLMIKAFEKKYSNIKVNIIERPKIAGTNDDMVWNEFLASRASVGTLPDVFMADDIPNYIINNWAYNLTELVKNDSEYNNISSDITDAATYDGKVMSLPSAVHYMGYIVNKTLYNTQGQDAPTVDTTMETLLDITSKAADHGNTNKNGVVGFEGIEHILHWYPAQLNDNYQWFTFDGDKFNLNSNDFTTAVNLYRQLATSPSYVLEALQTEANKEGSTVNLGDIFPDGDYFNNGKILCKWYYSYDFGWMQQKIDDGEYTWDLDFIGTPYVGDNKKVPAVIDFLTIASTTKHPEEAYLFAKWMGLGKDGYMERINLSNTVTGISKVNFAPIQNDSELLNSYFDIYPSFTGLRTIVETGTFVIEPPKFQVGYNRVRYRGTYDQDNTMYDIINKLMAGEVNIADIKESLNSQANAIYNSEMEAFEAALALR